MEEKEWTIMIYMAGDNNLAVDMAYAVQQIREVAGEGPNSPNLFVYYDGNSPDIPTLYCDFTEPENPKYVRSCFISDKLYPPTAKNNLYNENAADINSVYNFVHWCLNQVEFEKDGKIMKGRRAKRYAMIFSGHSLGFQDKGLFRDDTSEKTMTMNNLYKVIGRLTDSKKILEDLAKEDKLNDEERKRETQKLIGKRLDILGFDSCVMGMLEVGYQFFDVADTMISSEGSVPSAGWTYAKILRSLISENAGMNCKKVAELFVREFIKSQDQYTIGGVSVDMAAWDLSGFWDLASEFDNFALALLDCFNDPNSRIYRQMERVILQVHWKCQTYMFDQNIDISDFCQLLDKEISHVIEEIGDAADIEVLWTLQEQCRIFLKELRSAVILSGFSGGAYQYSNGISVFFPWSRETYEMSRKNYENLWISKEANKKTESWAGFLDKYLNEIAIRKFEPVNLQDAPAGSRYSYFSGVKFDDDRYFAEQENSDDGADEDSKLAGQQGSKLAGQQGSKLAGQQGSKLAGQQGSKLAGQQGSKLAGQQGSKLAGQQGSKLAGQQGSKLAGQQGSKMGIGGSNAFFESMRLFKNIESRWDISGFTRKPEDTEQPPEKSESKEY